MGEENQYMSVAPTKTVGASTGTGMSFGGTSTAGTTTGTKSIQRYDLRSHLNSVMNYRQSAKTKKAEDLAIKRASQSNQLYDASLNATDKDTSIKCDRASRMGILAKMIRDDAASAGVDWSMYDDVPTVDAYLRDNPEKADTLKNFVTADECPDATAFAEQMGFLKTPEQEQEEVEMSLGESLKNRAGNIVDTIKSPFETLGNGINKLVMLLEDDNVSAEENYAREKFGTNFYGLTPEQKAEVKQVMSTQEGVDAYKSTLQGAALDIAEGGTMSFFTMTAPVVTSLFAIAGNTPGTDYGVELLGKLMQGGGYYINKLPILSNYRDSLQTDEEKARFDAFVGTLGFAKLMKNYKKILNPKETITSGIESAKNTATDLINNPKQTLSEMPGKAIHSMVTETEGIMQGDRAVGNMLRHPSEIISAFKKLMQRKQTPEQQANMEYDAQQGMKQSAGKIAGAKDIAETDRAYGGLNEVEKQVGTEGVKTYEDLEHRIDMTLDRLTEQTEESLAKDTRKFTESDMQNEVIMEKDGYSSPYTVNPVREGLDLLREFYEGNPQKMAELDIIEQKLANEGLTRSEINDISKAIGRESNAYKDRGQQKTTKTALEEERIRDGVKDFARAGNEEAVELDKRWSNVKNTKQMIKDIRDGIQKMKNNQSKQTLLQKIGGRAGILVNKSGVTNFFSKVLAKKLFEGGDNYNALTRENQLSSNLKDFRKQWNKLNTAKTEPEIKAAAEEFNKYAEENFGPIEGEVIEPETAPKRNVYDSRTEWMLEDKIEAENTVNRNLTEDPQYNGNSPIDYTNPTRVTPQGSAGRYGQTIEEFKNTGNGNGTEYNTNNLNPNTTNNGGQGNYNGGNINTNINGGGLNTNGGANQSVLQNSSMTDIGTAKGGAGPSREPVRVESPEEMRNISLDLQSRNSRGKFMDVHSVEDYAGNKANLTSPNKDAALSLGKDGNIGNLIAADDAPKGSSKPLIEKAIELGGNKMDNYGVGLVRLYQKFGFEPVARVKWDDRFAPEGWNYERDGRPDIFFMKHNGDNIATVKKNYGKYHRSTPQEIDEMIADGRIKTFEGDDAYMEAWNYRDSLIDGGLFNL